MALISRTSWLGGALLALSMALMPASHAETRVRPPASASHPMDGLTADEISAAVDVLRSAGKFGDAARVVSMTIDENAKDEVRAWRSGQPFARRAVATLLVAGKPL